MELEEKNKRIKKEKKRLDKIFKEMESEKKNAAQGIIERAAYLRVTLEELEKDLKENGFTEEFQQGKNQTPYMRTRPAAELYNKYSSLYQKAVKQLTDLLPKTNNVAMEVNLDGFDSFVANRGD